MPRAWHRPSTSCFWHPWSFLLSSRKASGDAPIILPGGEARKWRAGERWGRWKSSSLQASACADALPPQAGAGRPPGGGRLPSTPPTPARDGADGNRPPSRRRPTLTLSHPRPAAKPVGAGFKPAPTSPDRAFFGLLRPLLYHDPTIAQETRPCKGGERPTLPGPSRPKIFYPPKGTDAVSQITAAARPDRKGAGKIAPVPALADYPTVTRG